MNDRTCWECKHNKLGGSTLLGVCSILGELSADRVDSGCEQYEPKVVTSQEALFSLPYGNTSSFEDQ